MLKAVAISLVLSTSPTGFIDLGKLIEPVKTEKPAPAPEGRKKRKERY